ncbi:hypothetical protein L9F63_028033, partial [Diploptera punctata]
ILKPSLIPLVMLGLDYLLNVNFQLSDYETMGAINQSPFSRIKYHPTLDPVNYDAIKSQLLFWIEARKSGIGPDDFQKKIKTEEQDESSSVVIKCEAYVAVCYSSSSHPRCG